MGTIGSPAADEFGLGVGCNSFGIVTIVLILMGVGGVSNRSLGIVNVFSGVGGLKGSGVLGLPSLLDVARGSRLCLNKSIRVVASCGRRHAPVGRLNEAMRISLALDRGGAFTRAAVIRRLAGA